jgi:hypothetical protein
MSKIKTVPAPFTFAYADLVPVGERKLRLFRNYAGDRRTEYIKACRLSTANVIEKSKGRDDYQHNNPAGYPVALIGGNMLDADNGEFCVAYFGIDTGKFNGAGYRYNKYTGLAAAEAAVERWAKRKFRVPAVAEVVAEPSAEEVKAVAEEVTAYISSTEFECLVPVLVQALFGEAGVYILKVPGEVKKSLNRLRNNEAFFFHGGAQYDADADCSFMYFERQPAGAEEQIGVYRFTDTDNDTHGSAIAARSMRQAEIIARRGAERMKGAGHAPRGRVFVAWPAPDGTQKRFAL